MFLLHMHRLQKKQLHIVLSFFILDFKAAPTAMGIVPATIGTDPSKPTFLSTNA